MWHVGLRFCDESLRCLLFLLVSTLQCPSYAIKSSIMLCNVFALSSGRMNKIILGLCPCSREAFAMYIIPLFTDHTAQVLFIIAIKNPHYNLVFQVFGVHTTRSMWLVELSTISIHDDQKTKAKAIHARISSTSAFEQRSSLLHWIWMHRFYVACPARDPLVLTSLRNMNTISFSLSTRTPASNQNFFVFSNIIEITSRCWYVRFLLLPNIREYAIYTYRELPVPHLQGFRFCDI